MADWSSIYSYSQNTRSADKEVARSFIILLQPVVAAVLPYPCLSRISVIRDCKTTVYDQYHFDRQVPRAIDLVQELPVSCLLRVPVKRMLRPGLHLT